MAGPVCYLGCGLSPPYILTRHIALVWLCVLASTRPIMVTCYPYILHIGHPGRFAPPVTAPPVHACVYVCVCVCSCVVCVVFLFCHDFSTCYDVPTHYTLSMHAVHD